MDSGIRILRAYAYHHSGVAETSSAYRQGKAKSSYSEKSVEGASSATVQRNNGRLSGQAEEYSERLQKGDI
jgi:antitoxin component YwqK of YwqJK toxin-antitoxin module